jgi:hypothetical protein
MRRVRVLLCPLFIAGVMGGWTAAAVAASPAKSPEPVAGEPSCAGLIIAAFNHESGEIGPSGNPTSSAGPGPFFGPGTHEAIEELARGPNC